MFSASCRHQSREKTFSEHTRHLVFGLRRQTFINLFGADQPLKFVRIILPFRYYFLFHITVQCVSMEETITTVSLIDVLSSVSFCRPAVSLTDFLFLPQVSVNIQRRHAHACARSAGSHISPPNPHLKKGFSQRVNFLPPSSPAQIQKYPSASINNLLQTYWRHMLGMNTMLIFLQIFLFIFVLILAVLFFLFLTHSHAVFSLPFRCHQGQSDPCRDIEGGRCCGKQQKESKRRERLRGNISGS